METDAAVTLRMVDGAPTITAIALKVVGHVAGIDQAGFEAATTGAKANCPVSKAPRLGSGDHAGGHPRLLAIRTFTAPGA